MYIYILHALLVFTHTSRAEFMNIKVPWPLPPKFVVPIFTPSLLVFYKNHNKECQLKKFEPFSKCGFVEIFS